MNSNATIQEVQTWPFEDRLELLFQLWDRLLDDRWKPTLDDDLKAELDRRWANYQENPERALTGEQVVAYARRPR